MAHSLSIPQCTLIAQSVSTRTEWLLVDGEQVVERAYTQGLNPFFLSRREISHCIRLELPATFFKRRWNHVYFYGAGCSNSEKNKIVESSLVAQFKTPVTVMSDLMAAARGLLVHTKGLACILGTGSNSCLYDGNDIVSNVRSLGFILGDEGSGSSLGRLFLGDLMKGVAPKEITEAFFDRYQVTPDELMDAVYNNPKANYNLSTYSFFLADHLEESYVRDMVSNELERFFERNICQYEGYRDYPVAFVGSVATTYSELLLEVASEFDVQIQKIVRNAMPGLINYHAR